MKRVFIFLFIIIISTQTFPLSLDELIGTERKTILLNQGSITETHLKDVSASLTPQHTIVKNLVNNSISELKPSVLVENLSIYKKKSTGTWNETERRKLFNSSLALSSLTGIEYYSTSRKTMRTLYEFSTVIDNPSTKRPLSDPVYTSPPRELSIYARQKDLTFGDNIYKYTYYTFPDAFVFIQQNQTPLTFGIVPAVGKDNLKSIVAVIDTEEYLLIYLVSIAKSANVPGINQRISESFSTRAEAIVKWFTNQVRSTGF